MNLIYKTNVVHAGSIHPPSKEHKQYTDRLARTWCHQSGWALKWHKHEAENAVDVQPPFRLCRKCFPRESSQLCRSQQKPNRVQSSKPCKPRRKKT